ncbi:hypothetical protein [Streptomyces sp. WAC00263]|uniref:hypothetical protein n=1 Tax=Streptomyces sp. WAC00263 TaxID=1917422 RepID=UPI0015EEEC95|nr:hypothetical protein [Streptomyces sp. WAC00263]
MTVDAKPVDAMTVDAKPVDAMTVDAMTHTWKPATRELRMPFSPKGGKVLVH